MKELRPFLCAFLVYICSSCANRVTPTGGEKDVKPPVVQEISPANYSTGLTARNVVITFDELVELKDLQKQLIVSPLMDPQPSITVKKKSVHIKLPDTLLANTTYTFNFGNSIVDIHEGNAIESFQYVFSTGAILDSMVCRGRAVDAWKQKGEKGVSILVYRSFDDSLPFKAKPDYFARTDDNGNFTISNMGAGDYMITAVNDKNGNYICDSPQDEAIALNQRISLPDTNELILNYFIQSPASLYIKKITNTSERRWEMAMNKPSDTLYLQPFDNNQPAFISEWNASFDSAFVWSSDSLKDSLYLKVMNVQQEVDTARIRLRTPASRGKGEAINNPFVEQNSTARGLRPAQPLEIIFMNPINNILSEKILLKEDSIVVAKFNVDFTDALKRKLSIGYQWKEEHQYNLLFLPGAITDFSGRQNDTLIFNFNVLPANELGTLHLTLSNLPSGNLYLELVTADYAAVRRLQIDSAGKYVLASLAPDKYKLRIVNDVNGNRRWDAGIYFKKMKPEPVYYYNTDIQVRGNWELEQEWKVLD